MISIIIKIKRREDEAINQSHGKTNTVPCYLGFGDIKSESIVSTGQSLVTEIVIDNLFVPLVSSGQVSACSTSPYGYF